MLCMSRKVNERFIIPTPLGPIEIVITSVEGKKVRVGFAADQRIKIYREEVLGDGPRTLDKAWTPEVTA